MRLPMTVLSFVVPLAARAGVWPDEAGAFTAAVLVGVFLLGVVLVAVITGMRRLAKWIFAIFLFLLVAASVTLGAALREFFAGG